MHVDEVRDLDGPNIFLLEPAIKVGFTSQGEEDEIDAARRLRAIVAAEAGEDADELGPALIAVCVMLQEVAGLPVPAIAVTPLEPDDAFALAFGWEHRGAALALATGLGELATGVVADPRAIVAAVADALAHQGPDDAPGVVRDADRRVPIVGITGTNGKTTSARLLAHVAMQAGRRVGWTSTTGVYIDGRCVLDGDYTGPSGAWRVLGEPGIDLVVLETARGGILQRGLGYESNDVSIFTNVTPDHIGLHGVLSVEGLAMVKSTVIAVTRPGGVVVLNADDPLVAQYGAEVRGRVVFVSRDAANPRAIAHLAAGGSAVIAADGWFMACDGATRTRLLAIADAPLTLGGLAQHMVENALGVIAAAIALGFTAGEVSDGLRSFRNDAVSNPGRMNVYELDGVSIVADYAHNEAGLANLLHVARGLAGEPGRVTAIIGVAGDRDDDIVAGIGRIAAELADRVALRHTLRYLRGRENNDAIDRELRRGVEAVGSVIAAIHTDELTALQQEVALASRGDVVAIMSVELIPEIRAWLLEQGAMPR